MADNSFDARAELEVGGRTFEIFRLDEAAAAAERAIPKLFAR